MTVIQTIIKQSFSYNGVGNYPFTFRVLEKPDLQVLFVKNATPPELPIKTLLVLDIDYILDINDTADGGNVEVINTELPGQGTDHSLEFERITPITQETDWVNGTPFPMNTLEHDVDKMTCIAQELRELTLALVHPGEGKTTGPVMTWHFTAPHDGPMPDPDDYGQVFFNLSPFFHKLRVFMNGSRLLEEIDNTVILGDFIVDWDNNNFTVKNTIPAGSTIMMETADISSFYPSF